MEIGAAGAFDSIAQQAFSPIANGFTQHPQSPVHSQPSGRFTQQVAEQQETSKADDLMVVLGKLKQMFEGRRIL